MATRFLLTAGVGLLGGFIFYFLHIPIPWLLGSMIAIMIYKHAFKQKVYWPKNLRNTGLILTGYTLGTAFTLETCIRIGTQIPSILLSTLSTVSFGLMLGYIAYKRTGISLSSAILGTTPGGMTQMATLSEEIKGGDVTIVTFMQTTRQLTVLFVIPFLVMQQLPSSSRPSITLQSILAIGPSHLYTPLNILIFAAVALGAAILAKKAKLPNSFLLGPLAATAVLMIAGMPQLKLPQILIYLAQLLIGIHLGNKAKIESLSKYWKALWPYALGGAVSMVFFALFIGYLLTLIHPTLTLVDAFLCVSPGSMPEMAFIALQVDADITALTAFGIFRVLFIYFVVPIAVKWRFGMIEDSDSSAL